MPEAIKENSISTSLKDVNYIFQRGKINNEEAKILAQFGDSIVITTFKNGRESFLIQIAEGQENNFKKALGKIKDKEMLDSLFDRSITDGNVGFKELRAGFTVALELGKKAKKLNNNLQTKASAQGPLRAFMLVEAANKALDNGDEKKILGALNELTTTRAAFESTLFTDSLFIKGDFMDVFTPGTLGDTLVSIYKLKKQCEALIESFGKMSPQDRIKYKNSLQITSHYQKIASNISTSMNQPKNMKILNELVKKEKDQKSKEKYKMLIEEIKQNELSETQIRQRSNSLIPAEKIKKNSRFGLFRSSKPQKKTKAEQQGAPHVAGLVRSSESENSFKSLHVSNQPKLDLSAADIAQAAVNRRKEIMEKKAKMNQQGSMSRTS